jgi:hypothetical protein
MVALFVTTRAAFPQRHVRHRRAVVQVVQLARFYHWSPPWLVPSYAPFPFLYPVPYAVSSPVPDYTLPSPSYVFAGSASVSYPKLVFKDGSSYLVADYWRKDGQLHFITAEDGGTKFVPHTVSFDDLDLEQTKRGAEAEGFRFLIRDKPVEQWLEEREPQGKTDRGH